MDLLKKLRKKMSKTVQPEPLLELVYSDKYVERTIYIYPEVIKHQSPNNLLDLPHNVFQRVIDYVKPRDVVNMMMAAKALKLKCLRTTKLVKTPFSEDSQPLYPIVSCDKNILIYTLKTQSWMKTRSMLHNCPVEAFCGILTEILRRSPFILEHLVIPVKDIDEDHLFLMEHPKFFKHVAKEIVVHVQLSSYDTDTTRINDFIQTIKPSFLIFSVGPYEGAVDMLLPCAIEFNKIEFDAYYRPILDWNFMLQIPYVNELVIKDTDLQDLIKMSRKNQLIAANGSTYN